jgi:hypothetical protein
MPLFEKESILERLAPGLKKVLWPDLKKKP